MPAVLFVNARWIDANPGLVKTMSVKPPRGSGRVRLVAIGDIDLQPCGGTHVRRTGDIGAFRIVGGHTDSPNLRLKQHPDRLSAGVAMVALEPYGGAWLNSWLDRDLGLSGRLAYRSGNSVAHTLVHVTEPVVRVPQLAIHLS